MYIKTGNYPSDTVIQNIKKITGKNAEQIEVHSLFNSEDEPFFNSVEGKDENLFAYPTLQMAMKWLREVHKIDITVDPHEVANNWIYQFHLCQNKNYLFSKDIDTSYEICAEAAIKYCLENLI